MNTALRKADLKQKLWHDAGGYADRFCDALIEVIIELEEKVERLEAERKPAASKKKVEKKEPEK